MASLAGTKWRRLIGSAAALDAEVKAGYRDRRAFARCAA
jgi:hypothetical protein